MTIGCVLRFQTILRVLLLVWMILPNNAFVPSSSTFALPPVTRKQLAETTTSTQLSGIPKMFRWLTDQYPSMNRRLSEGLTSKGVIDNFYLDMNGIIHPCTHGNNEDKVIVLDETAMYKKIFMYVDRLYKLVKPRKVFYLAVDGVAPRAKMNQQRSRRFRSAKEAEVIAAGVLAREGKLPDGKKFDSNCITPGTDFMLKLTISLRKWVEFKMEVDPVWQKGAHVVVSGPDVPGEGEHKVMDFIREQKQLYYKKQENGNDNDDELVLWGPKWTHVLFGLDADLIMLGLVTHEENFMLLREKMSVVMAGRGRHKGKKKKDMLEYDENDFEVLELSILKQLLALQFHRFEELGMRYDMERVVDDFVFMCMLVGNDFLPHMPHMEIDNGAISMMMTAYIEMLPAWKDYLTDKEKIHPERFEQFVYHIASYEKEHFKKRGHQENETGWKLSVSNEGDIQNDFYGTCYGGRPTPDAAKAANKRGALPPPTGQNALKDVQPVNNGAFKKNHPGDLSRSYRDFYYSSKLGWSYPDRDRTLFQRRAHVRDYLEGLHWVLNYYHNGCQSWDWYFPHLYAPLSTDMVNLEEFYEDPSSGGGFKTMPFRMGVTFPPLAQLLSVLPPQSADLLPKPLGELMLEPSSPLIQFYPHEFTSDANGKRQSWEAVVQIPFIEADVLLTTVEQILNHKQDSNFEVKGNEIAAAANKEQSGLLTKGERMRNMRGTSHVFQAPKHGQKDPTEETIKEGSKKLKFSRKPGSKSKRKTKTANKKS